MFLKCSDRRGTFGRMKSEGSGTQGHRAADNVEAGVAKQTESVARSKVYGGKSKT